MLVRRLGGQKVGQPSWCHRWSYISRGFRNPNWNRESAQKEGCCGINEEVRGYVVTRRTRVPPSTDCKSAAPWPASTTLLLPTGGAACHGYEGEVWSLSGRERSSASPLLAALGPPRLDLHINRVGCGSGNGGEGEQARRGWRGWGEQVARVWGSRQWVGVLGGGRVVRGGVHKSG
jgi:hypothetical protein